MGARGIFAVVDASAGGVYEEEGYDVGGLREVVAGRGGDLG